MYNITIFRDYIFKKPMFTTIFYSFIIFTFFIIPVNGELLEESYEEVDIYSDVNNSWDYSTRYEINTIKESESYTSYSISGSSGGSLVDSTKYYEHRKPIKMYIDFNLNNGLKNVYVESLHNVGESFIEGTLFHLMDGDISIGYGSFFMWGNVDGKLVYLYEFDYIDNIQGSGTYDILYTDSSIFDTINSYQLLVTGSSYYAANIIPSGGGIYLRSSHYFKYHHVNLGWISKPAYNDEMATTNTIENLFISENDIYYHYNIDDLIGYVEVDNIQSGYKIGLTHDIYNTSTEDDNEYYISDTNYRQTDQEHNNNRELGVKIDLYTDSTLNYPEHTFILDYGGISQTDSGYYGTTGGLHWIKFNPDTFYSSESQQYFDYYVNDMYEGYNFFITSVILHPNYPEGIEDYQNTVSMGSALTGNHILVENEFTFVPNVYCLRLYATISYPAFVEDAILLAESNPISITAVYVPPEQPPEHPDQPPNATSINQTLNNSWSDAYYDMVLSTNEYVWLPIYNFVVWTMLPITELSNNMILYNDAMENSFSESSSNIAVIASSINVITSGFHPKIVNLMTYYLIWLVLLIVLRKF